MLFIVGWTERSEVQQESTQTTRVEKGEINRDISRTRGFSRNAIKLRD
jgi:hypothetical protein